MPKSAKSSKSAKSAKSAGVGDVERSWLRFDRLDRFMTEFVVVAVWLLATSAFLGEPIWRWATGRPAQLAPGGELIDAAGVDRLLLLLPGVLATVLMGVGAVLLIIVLRAIVAQRAFVRANATRLRVLAVLLLLGPLAVAATEALVALAVVETSGPQGVSVSVHISWGWILAGLLTAAVAQAFAQGTRQHDELDGLV